MNVFLLPKQKFRIYLLFAGLMLWGHWGFAQTFEFLETVKNETVSLTFDNYSSLQQRAPYINEHPVHGEAVFNPSAPNNPYKGISIAVPTANTIEYTPDTDFIGTDYFIVKYRDAVIGGWKEKVVAITVWPTSVKAVPDYAMVTAGNSVTIDVLANDFSDGTNLTVYSIPHTNNGTAQTLQGDTLVSFTPVAGFTGVASFNYSICDAQNECDVATVSVCVLDPVVSNLDPVSIFTKKNTAQVILTPLEGFVVLNAPANGAVAFTSDDVWLYTPNSDFVGNDDITFENSNTNQQQVVTMKVLDAAAPNTFLRDDIAFVSTDGEVTVDALANDIGGPALESIGLVGGNPQTTANGGQVVYNYGSKDFTYIPAPDFEGIDEFIYKAAPPQYSGSYENATVTVVVSNLNPVDVLYQLKTPENTPLVIDYNIPLENYTYTNIDDSALNHGTVTFYPGETTISINGEDVTGFNMLVYYPNSGVAAGAEDEFEFEYCIGTQCELVKVEVGIVSTNPNADPECSGSVCVWPGDTNTDGVVDVRDVLPIGLCMGEVGLERDGAAVDWYPQYAEDWNLLGLPGFNVKHIDVDGDGIIASADTSAIPDYYGMHHNLTPQIESLNSDTRLHLSDFPANISAGDVILLDLKYGNENNPVIDAYGLTFELGFDPNIFESVNVIYHANSWMSYDSPILTLNHEPNTGKLHGGYSRTSGKAASGYGVIGTVEFIVIDDVIGLRLNNTEFKVSLNPMGGLNSAGQPTDMSGNTVFFSLNVDAEETTATEVTEEQVMVYPNPTTDVLTVHLNGSGNEVEQVVVYSLTGQEIYNSGAIQTKRLQLNVADYQTGMYMAKVFTNGGVFTKKFEVISK